MRVLLYSQQWEPGGSLRLLLNLARHLMQHHEVVLALDRVGVRLQAPLLRMYPEVVLCCPRQVADRWPAIDAALYHLPFSDRTPAFPKPAREVAVSMEVTALYAPTLASANASRFDAIGYLHPDQVRALAGTPFEARCVRLPVIDNINFEPEFVVTGRVAAISMRLKTGGTDLDRVIRTTGRSFTLDVYGLRQPCITNTFAGTVRLALHRAAGRLKYRGIQYDTRALMRSYDCLLHLPTAGNGTAVVVSDALHCGKSVVLSDLPEYHRAYGRFSGVHFINHLAYDLAPVLAQISVAGQQEIRDAYRRTYDRDAALRQWESFVTAETFRGVSMCSS